MPLPSKRSLPRLSPTAYLGRATLFWTHCLQDRKTRYLDPIFHHRFRELLCHALSRHAAICSAYTLMPDHIHLLVTGIDDATDQLQLTRLLRQELNRLIAPYHLQRQPHDHALRPEERDQNAYQTIAHYVLENPVRKQLCPAWADYPYIGCLVPGYFNLDPRQENYWDLFWRIHNKLATSGE